jgi:hypothetical protein
MFGECQKYHDFSWMANQSDPLPKNKVELWYAPTTNLYGFPRRYGHLGYIIFTLTCLKNIYLG